MRQRRLPLAGPAQHNARPARSAGGGFARLALLAAVLVLAAAAVSPLAARAAGPSVAAARGVDATVASVQWTRYSGGDFDYYRFTVCPQAGFIGGTCSNNVFTSPAYFDADGTGPVSVTGLDPDTAYGVVLEVWLKGRDSAIRSTATIPAQPAISFGGSTVADQTYAEGAAIAALTLPQAAGGAGTLTYSVSPALPEGLSFDASARTITGTPAAAQNASAYTYSATDGTDTAALSFSIRVAAQGAAESANAGQEATPDSKPPDRPKSVVVTRTDGALHAIWLAVKGATSYHVTYSSDGGASWSLAALNHPGSSITIGGVDNARTYIVGVRARSRAGDSGWLNSPPAGPYAPPKTPSQDRSLTFGSHTVPDQSWTKDAAIDTLRLPLATVSCNGAVCTTVVPEITYTLSPGLPAGASFDAAARTISGTPTAEAASATYTYTAAADGYDSASLTFTITVNGPTSPQPALSFGGATVDDQAYLQGTAIDTLTLPAATGGGSPTYSLSPTLPAGLSFDATARTITGTPTEAAPSASYSYSATDGTDTATLTFKIEVLSAEEGASAQAGLSWVTTPQNQNWQQGVAVNVQLPAATGADTIVYSLVNSGQSTKLDLPPGLSWNASTRTISGTPTGPFSKKVFVYNAAATNKGTHSNLRFQVADTNGNYPPYANIKSNDAQLLAQLWSHYDTNPGMSCYSGSVTFAPSSGHSVHFVDDGRRHDDLHGGLERHGKHLHQQQRLRRDDPQAPAHRLVLRRIQGDRPQRALRHDPAGREVVQVHAFAERPGEQAQGHRRGERGRVEPRRQQLLAHRGRQYLLRHRLDQRPGHGQGRDDAGLRDEDPVHRELPVHRQRQDGGGDNPGSTWATSGRRTWTGRRWHRTPPTRRRRSTCRGRPRRP